MPYVLLGNSFAGRLQMTCTNDQLVLEKPGNRPHMATPLPTMGKQREGEYEDLPAWVWTWKRRCRCCCPNPLIHDFPGKLPPAGCVLRIWSPTTTTRRCT